MAEFSLAGPSQLSPGAPFSFPHRCDAKITGIFREINTTCQCLVAAFSLCYGARQKIGIRYGEAGCLEIRDRIALPCCPAIRSKLTTERKLSMTIDADCLPGESFTAG